MTLLQKLEQIEERMENCVLQNRFDTFNQLASDRLLLLKKAMQSPDKEAVLSLAHKQSERWVELLSGRIGKMRMRRAQTQSLAGYGRAARTGRVINRSL
jgi:hypothetical protein